MMLEGLLGVSGGDRRYEFTDNDRSLSMTINTTNLSFNMGIMNTFLGLPISVGGLRYPKSPKRTLDPPNPYMKKL